MKRFKIDKIEIIPYLLILIAIVSRLIPHPPNLTAVGASSLYSGRYLSGKWQWLVPLLAMLITDYFLGWHSTIIFVYGAFALNIILGRYLNRHPTIFGTAGVTIVGSVIFFVITNFGVWLTSGLYDHSIAGLLLCYNMAIPFFGWTLAGDIIFVTLLFGMTEFCINRIKLNTNKQKELAYGR